MLRYIVTLTNDEIQKLKALIQKGGKGRCCKTFRHGWAGGCSWPEKMLTYIADYSKSNPAFFKHIIMPYSFAAFPFKLQISNPGQKCFYLHPFSISK